MNEIQQLLNDARKSGFTLVVNPGEQPAWHPMHKNARMPEYLLAKLKEHREAILEFMTRPRSERQVERDWSDTCRVCRAEVFPAVLQCGCSGVIANGSLVTCPYLKRTKQ